MDAAEKAHILAWWQEHVTIKDICQRTGRTAKSSIMALLAAARGLPPNIVLDTKARSDFVIRRELRRNPHLSASELKKMHPDLLGEVSIRCIQHHLQKDLKLQSCCAAQKPLLTLRMWKQRLCLQRYTYTGVWMIGKSCGPINQPFSASKVTRDVWDGLHSSAGWTLHTPWALSSTQHLSWFVVVVLWVNGDYTSFLER